MLLKAILTKSLLLISRKSHSPTFRGLKTMRAWQAFEYGGPEQLQLNTVAEIPTVTKSSDVLVKVHASSINPIDLWMLEGYGSATFSTVRQLKNCSLSSSDFPLTLGRDFSGTVVHIGKHVKNLEIGDEVWGVCSPFESGCQSEYVLSSSSCITKKPNSLNHLDAASLPYAGLTAWSALCTFGGLSETNSYKKRILIIGSSGGVGTIAVQLMKAWGANVNVICAVDAIEKMQELGADYILDYSSPDFKEIIKTLKGFDLILDNVGEEYPDLTLGLLKTWENSKYVTVVSPTLKNADDYGLIFGTVVSAFQAGFDTAMSLKDGKSFRWAYFVPNTSALQTLANMVEKTQVKPIIDKVYKFEDIPEAYEKCSMGHARGKTIIDHKLDLENNKEDAV